MTPHPAMLYAKKGERVTCMNGHIIGVFARDVRRLEVFTGDMLTDWQEGIDHSDGDLLGNCRVCGAAWNGGVRRKGVLHIEGHWRR